MGTDIWDGECPINFYARVDYGGFEGYIEDERGDEIQIRIEAGCPVYVKECSSDGESFYADVCYEGRLVEIAIEPHQYIEINPIPITQMTVLETLEGLTREGKVTRIIYPEV